MKLDLKIKTKLTCVRYPGGKSNALKFLDPYLIKDFSNYYEPFFGGGSVGLYLMQFKKDASFWINDLFYPVYCFWKTLYEMPEEMVKCISEYKKKYTVKNDVLVKGTPSKSAINGKNLHSFCRTKIDVSIKKNEIFNTACYWYILNKTSYSGMSMIGSYASLAWDQNFTDKCILSLPKTSDLLRSVKSLKITNLDYSELLNDESKNSFIFLDPPYKIEHNLYGNNGDMHRIFDHYKFYENVSNCKSKLMITYNNNPEIADLYSSFRLIPLDFQYTMKAMKRENAPKTDNLTGKSGKIGKELLILNY